MAIQGQAATTWVNPTQDLMVVDIFDQSPQASDPRKGEYDFQRTKTPAHTVRVEFPPGKEVVRPSSYDRAIHTVDKFGIVMGGLAPQLKRVGSADKLHPALDPDNEKRAEEERQKAIVQKQMAAAAELLSAAKDSIAVSATAGGQSGQKK